MLQNTPNNSGYLLRKIPYLLRKINKVMLNSCVLFNFNYLLLFITRKEIFADARRICSTLIDLIANGLKFVLNITETTYKDEQIKAIDENNFNEEPRIQELYRNICKENIRIRLRHDKVNIDDSSQKSIRSLYFYIDISPFLSYV